MVNICRLLRKTYYDYCMDESTVRHWDGMFKEGRSSVEDKEKQDRPPYWVTKETTIRIQNLFTEDARYTLAKPGMRMLLDCSRSSIQRILHDELGYSKLSAQ